MPGSSAGSDHSDKTVPLPPDAARDLSTGAASAPVQKQAMPDSLWKKIYARRNGQLVLLYDLENEEFLKSLAKKNNSETSSFSAKDMTYSYRSSSYASWSNLSVKSWGDFIEVACRTGLDLTGLAISPEQKKCQYEFEFQGKNLAGGKLDHAEFDGMDLSKTNFSNATMQHASLRDTTGQAPNFSSAKGLLMALRLCPAAAAPCRCA